MFAVPCVIPDKVIFADTDGIILSTRKLLPVTLIFETAFENVKANVARLYVLLYVLVTVGILVYPIHFKLRLFLGGVSLLGCTFHDH